MATKNFSKMATKKLEALMATASEENKIAIQAVLEARQQVAAKAAAEETVVAKDTLTAEEEAAIAAAEANGGLNPMYNGSKSTAEKKPKLTNEELRALAEELKANVGRKCQVVPFNTIEWVDGYIAGVVEEKRAGKVLYAIKTEDGRRIVKVHDSNLLRLMDEKVTITKAPRARVKNEETNAEWAEKTMPNQIAELIGNVGKLISFDKDFGGEIKAVEGRIVAIVPDKRVQRLLYRIAVAAPTDLDKNATITLYKVTTAEGLTLTEDEAYVEFNAKYVERYESRINSASRAATPQDRVAKCEQNLIKVEARLAKAQADLEEKKKQLEEAKAELEAYLAKQEAAGVQPDSPTDENESLA